MWTPSIHQVTCRQCLDALKSKHVGFEGTLFKQDDPQMQAMAILSGLRGHVIAMELETPSSDQTIKNMHFLISQLERLHNDYLPESW